MDGLKPLVLSKFNDLKAICAQNGITIGFVSGYRSIADQNALYAQGRTNPGNIVTNAKGGQSLHNYGVAFDVCPLVNGNFDWNSNLFPKIGALGKTLGLEWGGDWTSFTDLPHFQLVFDYSLEDFQNNNIDWAKYGISQSVYINPNWPMWYQNFVKLLSSKGLYGKRTTGT